MEIKEIQFSNAISPIFSRRLPNLSEERLEQPRKEKFPMLVTLSGISIDFKPVHPLNAEFPIVIKLLGRFIELKSVQFPKASASIEIKVLGRFTSVIPAHI